MRRMAASLLFAVVLVAAKTGHSQSQPSGELFSNAAVVEGITITREACAALEAQETAAWVTVDGKGECLRYYAAGLRPAPGPNPIAAAWMHGDIMGSKPTSVAHQEGLGVAAMIEQERGLAERFGIPFLFLARPGAYGSSGRFWTSRNSPREAALMNALLDALKARYGVREWALGGHSAGGTLTAELLARRDDLRCAIISSGAPAFRAYLEARGLHAALAKPQNWFDPYASLDRIKRDPERRIFVIGDPRETNIPFHTQRFYFDGLKKRGHTAWLVTLERAPPPRHHSLVDFGETSLGMCGRGDGTDHILKTLEAMPDQRDRISN
ncbi:alpha/beta hydrolase family protein [Azospirillum sp. sgz302134]